MLRGYSVLRKDNYLPEIIKCARAYQTNLLDKALLFVYRNDTGKTFIEVKFKKENFLHLTGVKTHLRASEFFDNCVNSKLKPNAYQPSCHTPLKLQVMPTMLNLPTLSATIGEYNNSRPYLRVDIIVAKQNAALGLTKENNRFYFPNTVLKIIDLGSVMENQYPILITCIKDIDSKRTNYAISYVNKRYDLNEIVREIPDDISWISHLIK